MLANPDRFEMSSCRARLASRRTSSFRSLAVIGLWVAVQTAAAQLPSLEPQALGRPQEDVVTFAWENDAFALKRTTDRWYTNGLHFAWNYKPGNEPVGAEAAHRLGRMIFLTPDACRGAELPTDDDRCRIRVTYGFGQSMYTPRVITESSAQPLDRPWAGWLYVGAGLTRKEGNHQQMVAYKMGPTGPASLARDVQVGWHRLLGIDHPAGWDQQLRPKLGIQLSYLSAFQYRLTDQVGVQLSVGGLFGNLRRSARVGLGLTWRPSAAPGAEPSPYRAGTLDEGEFLLPEESDGPIDMSITGVLRHGVYYIHVQGAAVFHNEFLTGRTFGERSRIEPIAGVVTTTIGFTIPLDRQRRQRLGWAYKLRTPEFRVADISRRDAYQRWAALTYSRAY